MMTEADVNKDQLIDFNEFVPAFMKAIYDEDAQMCNYPDKSSYPPPPAIARSRRDTIYDIFDAFDSDGDGFLTEGELVKLKDAKLKAPDWQTSKALEFLSEIHPDGTRMLPPFEFVNYMDVRLPKDQRIFSKCISVLDQVVAAPHLSPSGPWTIFFPLIQNFTTG